MDIAKTLRRISREREQSSNGRSKQTRRFKDRKKEQSRKACRGKVQE